MQVDMLVGDIYGDRDYSSIGLSANTIASSFGKVIARAFLHFFHSGGPLTEPLMFLWHSLCSNKQMRQCGSTGA